MLKMVGLVMVINVILAIRRRRERQVINVRMERRFLRDSMNPFALPEETFRRLYRFPPLLAYDLLNLVEDDLMRRRNDGIPNHVRFLVALYFFANGSYQAVIGNCAFATVSQPTVSKCVTIVARAVVNVADKFVKFPTTLHDRQLNKLGFLQLTRFAMPGIIAAVDGTQVSIVKPWRNESVFVNRKGYHSINLQVVCRHDKVILSANAKFPGSTHDAFIWRDSAVQQFLNRIPDEEEAFILGDRGYPSQPRLLVPCHDPARGSPQAAFNKAHSRGRVIVENTIGLLKGWLRCLLKDRTLHYQPQKAALITQACIVLHNVCVTKGIEEMYEWDDHDREVQHNLPRAGRDPATRNGDRARENYIAQYFTGN